MKIDAIWNAIQTAAGSATGRLGVCFRDLQTGESCALHGDESFPSASVFKVFVLAELFRQREEGRFRLEDRYPLREEDKAEGSGVLRLIASGAQLTLRDYATLMMILSDNTAADFLFRLTGRDEIKKHVLDALKLTHTKCDLSCADLIAACYQTEPGASLHAAGEKPALRNAPAYTGKLALNDETAPADVADMLELVYRGHWIGLRQDAELLEIMKLCQTNGRIPKYLPSGLEVAHKTGTMDRVANDAGIVYTAKGDYILSMFYNGNVASEEEYAANDHNFVGDELLAHLSKEIYDLFIV